MTVIRICGLLVREAAAQHPGWRRVAEKRHGEYDPRTSTTQRSGNAKWRFDVQVKLTERSKWLGEVAVVPRFAGICEDVAGGEVSLAGMKVGQEEGETTLIRAGDRQVVLVSLGEREKCVADTFRRAGGRITRWLGQREVASAGIETAGLDSADLKHALPALTEGLILGEFRFDEHKPSAKPRTAVEVELLVKRIGRSATAQVERAIHIAQAVNLAREIAHQPPNVINPVSLAARAKKLAAQCRLKCTVLDEKQMKRLKMGGILAVGQGSDTPPRLIILEYPGRGTGKPVVLVGKAITFDTGGYSIKPKDGIVGMKYDKCGAVAVLGTMTAAAALQPKTVLVGVIAAAENMVSGGSYRPDDIITTMSGQTVEIVSADAEGRMVLCDALTYAQKKYEPRAIIDLATLTGGVVVALGKQMAGLFSNNDVLRDSLIASGRRTHERLWPLPLDDDYLEPLKGTDSDLKNSAGRDGHAVLGAMFLKQFVEPKVRWAHLDIAGVADVDKDQPYCPKGATGFGVRLLADYLERVR